MNIYAEVTNKIVAQLESGVVPWVKPWCGGADRNVVSGKEYNGINRLLLAMSGQGSSTWATFKQWQDMGASVKKGEKGTHIVFFSKVEKKEAGPDGEPIFYPMLKTFSVFSADQVNGYDAPVAAPRIFNAMESCEDAISRTGATIAHGGGRACYIPGIDTIRLPAKTDFTNEGGYYATAFHELAHWSGAKGRLNRDLSGRFGEAAYAAEELIAEIGAAFMCRDHGIDAVTQHASYIKSWMSLLRADPKAVFAAAAAAEKAHQYLSALNCRAALAA